MRADLAVIAGLVGSGVRVLDLGCGDGQLLEHLIAEQDCAGHGVERSAEGFHACVARGVPVTQADIEDELPELGADGFDCVVLSHMLPATRRPARVLSEIARVAPRRVVSLPNLAFWPHRLSLAARGAMPATPSWHESPNLHPGSLRDFERLVAELGQRVRRRVLLGPEQRPAPRSARVRPNLLAAAAVYVLESSTRP
jgi:methionine biosynthesis protein MetW